MDFLYKAMLTATAVALVMLVARSFGEKVAGLVAGLPFTALPALVWIDLGEGHRFATEAAAGTVAGCALAAVFAVLYQRLAQRWSAAVTLPASLTVVALGTFLIGNASDGLADMFGLALLAGAAALTILQREAAARFAPRIRSGVMVLATAIVAGLATAALSTLGHALDPGVAGMLAGLPIVGAAAVTAEHVNGGTDCVTGFLRGYVVTTIGKAVFGAALALTLVKLGLTTSIALALVAGAATCWALQLLQAAMAQAKPRDDEIFVNSSFG